MSLKKETCHTSGTRHQLNIRKNVLSKYSRITKGLTKRAFSNAGRNNTGRITVRRKGGGCKKRIHMCRVNSANYTGIVTSISYCAKRNALISLNFDLKKNEFFKTVYIKNVLPGCLIKSSFCLVDFKLGCKTRLSQLPVGSILNSIELRHRLKFCTSAGTFCQLLEKRDNGIKVRLPSGSIYTFLPQNTASLGAVGNAEIKLTRIGKAGRNRLKGIRPSVRGIAMNPVDHPHGGKSNKGKPPVTPWGLPTKNKPTRKKRLKN